MADEQVLSERIKKMAEVATEYKLWGRNTANRSSLLNPLSTVFKNLRRMSPEMDLAFVKAQTIDDIFAHIGRVRRQTNPRFKIGQNQTERNHGLRRRVLQHLGGSIRQKTSARSYSRESD